MELVVQILMLFIIINSVLKLSFWKWWQSAVFGLLCGVFVVAVYPLAIMQSKSQLVDYLANTAIMQDTAVVVTLEAAVCFAYCFLASKKLFGGKISRWGKVLHWYVSILLFPVLFIILTQTIYAMPGTGFKTIAWVTAAVATVGIPLLSRLARWLLPEADFRMEVHFLVSLFVCVLGLITTVNGNVTYAAVDEPFNARAFITAITIFAVAFGIGMGGNKLKWIILQRKSNKKHSK